MPPPPAFISASGSANRLSMYAHFRFCRATVRQRVHRLPLVYSRCISHQEAAAAAESVLLLLSTDALSRQPISAGATTQAGVATSDGRADRCVVDYVIVVVTVT